ncbi:MAG: type III secretion system inner membrane ring subunit SctD [Victivallaceae bacterium]
MAVQLIAKKGPSSGILLSLDGGSQWSLGNDPSKCDILIKDNTIAGCQILISKSSVGYSVRSLDQEHIVKVNGQSLAKEILLKNQDEITLGQNVFVFDMDGLNDDAVEFEIEMPEKSKPSVNSDKNKSISGTDESSHGDISGNNETRSGPRPNQGAEESSFINALGDVNAKELPEVNIGTIKSSKNKKKKHINAVNETTSQSVPLESGTDNRKIDQNIIRDDDPAMKKQDDESTDDNKKEDQTSDMASDVLSGNKIDTPQDFGEEENGQKKKDQSDVVPNSNQQEDQIPEQKDAISEELSDSIVPSEVEEKSEDLGQENNDSKKTVQSDDTAVLQEGLTTKDVNEKSDVSSTIRAQVSPISKKDDKSSPITFGIKDLFDFDQEIFSVDDEASDTFVDLSQVSRFLLKVIAGPNIGAEFSLEIGQEYTIGSDPKECDIVFNDLSVSHKHAKLILGQSGTIIIEDSSSKNGVIVDGKKIEHEAPILPNQVLTLGTTLFLIIDREAPVETIVSSLFLPEIYSRPQQSQDESSENEEAMAGSRPSESKATISTGAFILAIFVGGLAILFGIGAASLFRTKEIFPIENVDFHSELEGIIKQFTGVRFTYNKNNGQLFLIGHISNSISKSELLYKLDALPFVKSIDDNIIDNELVWQEMNIFLSKNPDFKGVSMHSPNPGEFVLTGYLQTEEQAADLVDYLNIHFNYVSLLKNKVVVEKVLLKEIGGLLLHGGFAGVQVSFSSGDLVLTGYINNAGESSRFNTVVDAIAGLPGVRKVKNFVVQLPTEIGGEGGIEGGVVDLAVRYPNRYKVTGFSKYGDVNINVVINGRIVTRGDIVDGMTVTSIQANCIFLEKSGVKFKIEYNK